MTTASAQGNSETITRVVTQILKPEHEDAFLAHARAYIRAVEDTEPDVILCVMGKHPTLEHAYIWIQRFKDEAAFAAHREEPHVADAHSLLQEWLAKPGDTLRITQLAPR